MHSHQKKKQKKNLPLFQEEPPDRFRSIIRPVDRGGSACPLRTSHGSRAPPARHTQTLSPCLPGLPGGGSQLLVRASSSGLLSVSIGSRN